MSLHEYYHALSRDEKELFADRAGTNTLYLRVHLIPSNGRPDRTPRKGLMLLICTQY